MWVVKVILFMAPLVQAQNADFSKLDKCLKPAVEIAKSYLSKDGRLPAPAEQLDYDVPGQTFGAGGTLIYCVTAVDRKTHQMVSQDVVVGDVSCDERARIDKNSDESACRYLEDLSHQKSDVIGPEIQ